jgi:hypothetical protein
VRSKRVDVVKVPSFQAARAANATFLLSQPTVIDAPLDTAFFMRLELRFTFVVSLLRGEGFYISVFVVMVTN